MTATVLNYGMVYDRKVNQLRYYNTDREVSKLMGRIEEHDISLRDYNGLLHLKFVDSQNCQPVLYLLKYDARRCSRACW